MDGRYISHPFKVIPTFEEQTWHRICVLGFICFFICRVAYTYLLVYSEIPKPDTGGAFWCAQLHHVQQGLFIYVLCLWLKMMERLVGQSLVIEHGYGTFPFYENIGTSSKHEGFFRCQLRMPEDKHLVCNKTLKGSILAFPSAAEKITFISDTWDLFGYHCSGSGC
jgi:hypothetical protein